MVYFAVLLLAAAAFFLIVMVIDNHRFVVRRYLVRSARVRSKLRIVFIADLHEKDYGGGNEDLVREIAALQPDMILVGGDLIISGKVKSHSRKSDGPAGNGGANSAEAEWMKNSIALMKKLSRICPVWFVRGNHEIRLSYFEELREFEALFKAEMEAAGVHYIENSCVDPGEVCSGCADSGIRLQGLELPMDYYTKFKKTALSVEDLENLIGKPFARIFRDICPLGSGPVSLRTCPRRAHAAAADRRGHGDQAQPFSQVQRRPVFLQDRRTGREQGRHNGPYMRTRDAHPPDPYL